jgi:hypothetical protein
MVALGDAGVPTADAGHDAAVADAGAGDGSIARYDAAPPVHGHVVMSSGCSAMPGRGASSFAALVAGALGLALIRRRRAAPRAR